MAAIIPQQNEIDVYANEAGEICIKESDAIWHERVPELLDAVVCIRVDQVDLLIEALQATKQTIIEAEESLAEAELQELEN